jgi:hypothetical protein
MTSIDRFSVRFNIYLIIDEMHECMRAVDTIDARQRSDPIQHIDHNQIGSFIIQSRTRVNSYSNILLLMHSHLDNIRRDVNMMFRIHPIIGPVCVNLVDDFSLFRAMASSLPIVNVRMQITWQGLFVVYRTV